MSVVIGIDNGPTGSIGIMRDGGAVHFGPIPTQPYLHYGKKGTISNRLDRAALKSLLANAPQSEFHGTGGSRTVDLSKIHFYIERPFTGSSMMIKSMLSSARFFEATIITLEDLGIGYEVIDSGVWQKPVLGDVKGSKELKLASMLRGRQIYPQFSPIIGKQGDADGLLIAHHFSRQH
jgi:hypothetical protein